MKLSDIKKMKPIEFAKWYNRTTKTELISLLAIKLKNNTPKAWKLMKETKDGLLDLLLKNKDMKYRYNEEDVDKAYGRGLTAGDKTIEDFKSIFGDSSKDYKGLYKQLAKYLHPDKPTGNEELFKAISILK